MDKDAYAFFEQCADSAVNGAEALRIDTLQSEWASTRRECKFTAAADIPLEGVAQLAEGTDGDVAAIGQFCTQANAQFRHEYCLGVASGSQADRSEEHTSELQSLMRISYAVFCLKKKQKHPQQYN